jgi:hypothetical protein
MGEMRLLLRTDVARLRTKHAFVRTPMSALDKVLRKKKWH